MRSVIVYIVVSKGSRNPVLSWFIYRFLNSNTGFEGDHNKTTIYSWDIAGSKNITLQ